MVCVYTGRHASYIHTQLKPDWLLHMCVCMYVCRLSLLYHEIEINNGIDAAIAPSICGTVVHGGGHGYLQGLPKQPNCFHGSCFQPPSLAVSPKVSLVQEGLILLCPPYSYSSPTSPTSDTCCNGSLHILHSLLAPPHHRTLGGEDRLHSQTSVGPLSSP